MILVGCASRNAALESRFNAADVDGDGLVSRSEATDMMIAEVFEVYDTDGNIVIDEAEFVAGGGDAAKFRAATKATGGRMTLADARAHPVLIEMMAVPFDEADTNGNGAISLDELAAYKARLEAAVR